MTSASENRAAFRRVPIFALIEQTGSGSSPYLFAVDALCTDKTGTLTEAHIHLDRRVSGLGIVDGGLVALDPVRRIPRLRSAPLSSFFSLPASCREHDRRSVP
jgi:hypothetical protein